MQGTGENPDQRNLRLAQMCFPPSTPRKASRTDGSVSVCLFLAHRCFSFIQPGSSSPPPLNNLQGPATTLTPLHTSIPPGRFLKPPLASVRGKGVGQRTSPSLSAGSQLTLSILPREKQGMGGGQGLEGSPRASPETRKDRAGPQGSEGVDRAL